MDGEVLIIKGDVVYSRDKKTLETAENSFLVAVDGCVVGVYSELPEDFEYNIYIDYSGHLIMPGMTDLHLHAPQYAFRGLGMDLELIEWLDKNAFSAEARFSDENYATLAYEFFRESLRKSETTRACVFSTIHPESTDILMEMMNETGICSYVGKVNMDRNGADYYQESDTETSLESTRKWIEETANKYEHVKPIITPRFVPTCSMELLKGLGELASEYKLPVQSHLSETKKEIEWVSELEPWAEYYGQVYEKNGLFGGEIKTVMAHCVHSCDAEVEAMKENGVYVAHCPASNTNLASGIAPIRKYLDKDLNVGLGTDIAGGYSMSILRAMADAIQVSKLRKAVIDENEQPVTLEEAFYMGTMGGGAFFGQVGSFLPGYECDIVVIDDKNISVPGGLNLRDRLERAVYMADECELEAKYVKGVQVL